MKHDIDTIRPIALEIWNDIKQYCSIIKIAGSIRRQKDRCKDIEIVLLPKDRSCRNKIGMYFLSNGRIKKGKFTGRHVSAIYKSFPVDIFIPQEFDYYRQLAIRTGSAEYSKKIASTWVRMGYEGTPQGLKSIHEISSEFDPPQSWESEQHFFQWLGMEYLEPKYRN